MDLYLKARVRPRDKDIAQALKELSLEEGEKADMIRNGFRRELADRGMLTRPQPITPDMAQRIARELVKQRS